MIFSPPQLIILGVALNQLPVYFYCIDSPGKPPGPPAVSEGKYGFSWPSPLLLKRPDLLARASGNLPSPRVLSNRGFWRTSSPTVKRRPRSTCSGRRRPGKKWNFRQAIAMHNFPIYDDYRNQSTKVFEMPLKQAWYDSNSIPKPCEIEFRFP